MVFFGLRQAENLVFSTIVVWSAGIDCGPILLQGENGDLKNRSGLKVEINHVVGSIGGPGDNTGDGNLDKSGNGGAGDNFPDSSIGEGMDITIQGANGHVKNSTTGK